MGLCNRVEFHRAGAHSGHSRLAVRAVREEANSQKGTWAWGPDLQNAAAKKHANDNTTINLRRMFVLV